MLNLIVGRQGSGKTNTVYSQIESCINQGEDNLILIVPEQFTVQAERELVEKLDSSGIIHVEVLSFSRLGNRILEESGEINYSKVSQTGKYMILQKSLIELEDQLSAYGGMVRKPGFIDGLQDFISNLKRRMVTCDAISDIVENEAVSEGLLKEKLRDIGKIYLNYNKWMENYLDNEEVLNKVIDLVDESKMLIGSKIWIDGFHTFTEQNYCLIKKLLKISKELTVTLTQCSNSDRDKDIFEINEKTREKLIELAEGKCRLVKCSYQSDKSVEIRHLERELYAYPWKSYSGQVDDIKLHCYKNIYDELDGLCINMVKLVRRAGYRWRDIKVATNDLNVYSFPIKRYFEEYDIPFFMDSKRNISDKPLSILIINTLKIIAYNYQYEDVFAMLKTGLTDVDYEDYEQLENYVLQYGIKGKQWEREFTYIGEKDTFDLDHINEVRKSIVSPILELEDKIKHNPTFKEISIALFDYLSKLEVELKLKDVIWELKGDYQQYEYASEISQIYNIVMEILDEIVEIFGDEETTIQEYIRILKAGVESVDLAIIPSSLDQVMVGDITRSRNTEYKVLFVVGANEGKLPSQPSTKGLLSDYESTVIREKGLDIADDIGYKSTQENYLIYNQLSKTSDKLFISFPLADFEGGSLRPSTLIGRVKDVFPHIGIERGTIDLSQSLTNAKGTLKHLINHLQSLQDVSSDNSIWSEVYKWYSRDPQWSYTIAQIKDALGFDNQVEKLSEDKVEKLYGKSIRTSVTRLEEYANCPFKHFVTFGLRPRLRRVYEISIPDLGEILHKLVYDFSLKIEGMGLSWRELEKSQIKEICREVVNDFAAEYRQGILVDNPRYKHLAKYVYRTFVKSVETLTYHYARGKFEVTGNELIFGINGQLPPVKVELPDEYVMYLEGRIDRVDILEVGNKRFIKVMDFKTGNKDISLQEIYYGLSLQLLVYMWVCLNYGKKTRADVSAAGMFYFKMHDPMVLSDSRDEEEIEREIRKKMKLKGLMIKDENVFKSLDENVNSSDVLSYKINKDGTFKSNSKGLVMKEQLDVLIEHTKKTIEGMGREIFDGNIAVFPSKLKDREACTYCNYKPVCLFDNQLTADKFNRKQELKDEEVISLIEKEKNCEIEHSKER